ncbi:MAG: GH92 family glycosyl hydrolase [Pirellulales bacterium]|nr:GH92 family glycosyl hydrolase [Pirellulales bacterium]
MATRCCTSLFVLAVAGGAASQAAGEGYAAAVNTLQGTNSQFELSRGNTYPATALPWGMHTWTPQTGRNGDGWKYQYRKRTIRGFQQAHQCSSWSNDYAVFSLMPVVGTLEVHEDRRATGFRHEDEVGRPHHYRVALASGVVVDMTPSERGALLRFAFPDSQRAFVVFDGYSGNCTLEVQPDRRRLVGRVRNQRGRPGGIENHFIVEFENEVLDAGVWRHVGDGRCEVAAETRIAGSNVGGYVEFPAGATVVARVASSYIDAQQAELTLATELPRNRDFEGVRTAAEAAWEKTLGAVHVEGGTDEQRRTFYSCLFRASLLPRMFYEYDAAGEPRYRSPYDGQVHAGRMFTDTGFWDVFRAQMPLNVLLRPEMQGQYMQALLAAHEQCGWLPSWSFPEEQGSMLGNHAASLLADAWAKGIRTFDPAVAAAAYDHESSHKGPWGPANGRGGADLIERLGYLPYPDHREATAKTLEYAYDDFCGYRLALAAGDDALAETFLKRATNYRNVFDPQVGFMRGKDAAGRWTEPFDPIEWGGPYAEGCAWHWTWSVFHDVAGLIDLFGGDEPFVAKLDGVFAAPSEFKPGTYGAPIHEMREMVESGLGQYAHGNQPIQHMIYLYCYAGAPWKTQYWARLAMDRLYDSTENGYPGDEDQGQTSSWYVMSALGLYCVCPGTDEYVLGSPLFPRATIDLGKGRRFVITCRNQSSANVYVQSAELNGRPLSRNFLRHEELVAGGELTLEMGPQPNFERGTAPADRPFSLSTADSLARQPAVDVSLGK